MTYWLRSEERLFQLGAAESKAGVGSKGSKPGAVPGTEVSELNSERLLSKPWARQCAELSSSLPAH